ALTGYDWSPESVRISLARDLMLAGQPVAARDVAREVSWLEASDVDAVGHAGGDPSVQGGPGQGGPDLGPAAGKRQNLYRFAGDLGRAASVTDEWVRADPRDGNAWNQAGEIAFLRHQYAEAANRFAGAAEAFTAAAGTGSADGLQPRLLAAEALLKKGAAL